MLTKAIILAKEPNTNKYTIRLPLFESAASKDQFIIKAALCCDDGVVNPFALGDTVYVGFEDNGEIRPVILGKLSKDGLLDYTREIPTVSYYIGSLEVVGTTKLSKDVTIGEISYQDLYNLFQKVSSIDSKLSSGYYAKEIGISASRTTLKVQLHNFTKDDIGKEIHLYRTSKYCNKGYKHPIKYGYGSLQLGNQCDGQSGGHYYPDVPDWMPNDGLIQTEWTIDEEMIENGGFEIDYIHDWLCLVIPKWYNNDWHWINVFGTAAANGTVKIKFGLVSNGQLQLLSTATLRLGSNYSSSSDASLALEDESTGEYYLNHYRLYMSIK